MERSLIQGTITICFSKSVEGDADSALKKFISKINNFNVDMREIEMKNEHEDKTILKVNDVDIEVESCVKDVYSINKKSHQA